MCSAVAEEHWRAAILVQANMRCIADPCAGLHACKTKVNKATGHYHPISLEPTKETWKTISKKKTWKTDAFPLQP
jgi:hypothetical protein